jgi:hypothetical protein
VGAQVLRLVHDAEAAASDLFFKHLRVGSRHGGTQPHRTGTSRRRNPTISHTSMAISKDHARRDDASGPTGVRRPAAKTARKVDGRHARSRG